MNLEKNKKALFLTDIENGLEPILQEVTNIQAENMLNGNGGTWSPSRNS
jgi:hypothetical protein